MARMRLQKYLYPYIKEKDPGTAFTPNLVRRWALSGVIPCHEIGNKKLYNLDDLDRLLDNPEMLSERLEQAKENSERGKIRKIS